MYNKPESYDFDKINGEEVIKVIKEYINVYNSNDDKETWFSKMKDVAEKCGYAREVKEYKADPEKWPGHVGDISSVIRVAITGRRNTPDLYEIMNVLGNDEVIARLNKAIQ
jgi:glutamate--tRNA ligase